MSKNLKWFFASVTMVVFWCPAVFALIGAEAEAPDALALRYPEVVRLQGRSEVCTGTIVGPRVVLSAAHCATLTDSYFVYNGRRYSVQFSASAAYQSKEHDVAVAITDRDIVNARYAEIGQGVRHGSVLTLAGYGCTKRGGRAGSLHIGLTKVIGMDSDHILSFLPKGGVLCQGDSGGPAFLREGGRNVVVAVNSAGDIKNINLHVRLDSSLSRGFLRSIADKFAVSICGVTTICGARAMASNDKP
jgi:V8-like Glu-specific endopeptidase